MTFKVEFSLAVLYRRKSGPGVQKGGSSYHWSLSSFSENFSSFDVSSHCFKIHFEYMGQKTFLILLLHGWLMKNKIWKKNNARHFLNCNFVSQTLALLLSDDLLDVDFLHFGFFQVQYIYYCWKHYVERLRRIFYLFLYWSH